MTAALMAFCAVVIVGMVALVAAVVWAGVWRPGYDIAACVAAYQARKASGEIPNVMEPAEQEGLLS